MSDVCPITSDENLNDPVASFDPGPGKHVLFFGDPMCSWCWGFSPDLKQIADMAQGRAQFHVVMGGLRPGTRESWDATMRAYIRHHWQDVAAKTGQPFNFDRFDDEDFVYDTEPACRAVVTVRSLDPSRTLAMYEALQRGFYAENLDITKTEVLADLAQSVGLDRDRFVNLFEVPGQRQLVAADFIRTQSFGVQGFPSLLCAEDGKYGFLALGYRPFAAMQGDFAAWLDA
ncbi:DsbA family protein [Magnetovibrio blakemorei]|nr:DsbA family protein [Magnetovibrio blakemorei]